MHDLIIKGGTVVDGTGSKPFQADVAIKDGVIVAVGQDLGPGREIIDAENKIVTPGFVDVHTHYDGQATWDELLTPSCWHGVTTCVMGNCGVGFAPVKKGGEDFLIQLMEGVEDIPGSALSEGMKWGWESFPEYLDSLEEMSHVMDIGTQIAHGPVRAYVMGERGARNEPATPEDIEGMAAVVKEAVTAGALGFSTSRTIFHRAVDGEPVPGTYAADDELFGIGRVLGELGKGIFEVAPAGTAGEDMAAPAKEIAWMRKLSAEIKRTVSFALVQHDVDKDHWREVLRLASEAVADGADLRPQVTARPSTLLLGFQVLHPFQYKPSYKALESLPLDERVKILRDPEVRARILSEENEGADPAIAGLEDIILNGLDKMFPLGEPPNYEPAPETSIKARADKAGVDPFAVLYDEMLTLDGKQLVMLTLFGYSEGNFDALREMLENPITVFGLGDGGAHVVSICDASMTTSLISHWARDRSRGPKLPLELTVRKMTQDTASLYGLNDRGVVAVGKKGDLNVINFEELQLGLPSVAYDLPAGAKRILQKAGGYEATIVSGVVTMRNGEHTGALPGKVIRGATAA